MLEMYVDRVIGMHDTRKRFPFLMERGLTAREARSVCHPKQMRQLRDSLLQRLCEGLLCTPNDVFRWVGAADNELMQLNVGPANSIATRLQRMTDPKEAERMLQRALKMLEEEPLTPRMHGGRLFINVKRLLEQRGMKRYHWSLMRMGFSHGEAARLLSNERKAVKISLLTRVCVAFKCLPNDVYDFEGPAGHVLLAVKKAPVLVLDERLSKLTEAQLRRLLEGLDGEG